MDILKLLRDEQHVLARRSIYETFIEYGKENNIEIFKNPNIREKAELVKRDFDEIGALVEFGYLNKSILFALYSDTIRRCWLSLDHDIKRERKQRSLDDPDFTKASDHFMKFFEKLAEDARIYRKQNNLGEPGFTDLRSLSK